MSWQLFLALGLDLWLADPKNLPHPVQGIGMLANALEGPARKAKNQRLAGVAVMALLLAISGGVSAALSGVGGVIGAVCSLWLCWSGLALGALLRDGKAALAAVEKAEKDPLMLPEARKAVQMLVSRETNDMAAPELYRSVADSVSENFNDAFVAPWFWLCLGGPVGLWLYKTTSTMDSMWGYKNEHWQNLGWAAARLDDLLAFVPARLSAFFMFLTAFFERLPWTDGPAALVNAAIRGKGRPASWPGWNIVAGQAGKYASPNAGWPMAAAAWLFGGKSGGATPYDGVYVVKPPLGPADGRWQAENVEDLINHVRLAGLLGAATTFAAIKLAVAM